MKRGDADRLGYSGNNVASGADPTKVIEILNTLPNKVAGIRTWTLGKHQGAPGGLILARGSQPAEHTRAA